MGSIIVAVCGTTLMATTPFSYSEKYRAIDLRVMKVFRWLLKVHRDYVFSCDVRTSHQIPFHFSIDSYAHKKRFPHLQDTQLFIECLSVIKQ